MLPNCSQMLFFFWFDCQADPARELIVKSWKRGNKTFHDDQIQGAWTGWAWHNHSQPRSHFWPGSTEFPIQDDHLHDGSGLVFFFIFLIFIFFFRPLVWSSSSPWCWCLLSLPPLPTRTTRTALRSVQNRQGLYSDQFSLILVHKRQVFYCNLRALLLLPLDCPSPPAIFLQFPSRAPG